MKRLIFTLLACGVAFGMVYAKTLNINVAAGAITVDGTGDEDAWAAVSAYTDMVENKGDVANKNNSAKFKMTYNADYVYVLAEVTDSKLDTSQSKNVWEKDCIEVFFSLDTANQKSASSGANAFYQLRKVFGRDMTDATAKGFKAAESESATGRVQEWSLAWDSIASTIKDKAKWDNKNFRFEIQNGDNDGSGRNSQLFWNNNADDQWNSIKNQGYVVTQYFVGMNNVNESANISIANNVIRVKGLAQIDIYNVNGQKVKSVYGNQLSVANLTKNQLYIATANGESKKFIVK